MKIKSSRVYQFLMGLSLLMLISGWRMGYSENAEYVPLDSVTIAEVQSGDFSVKIEGYGSLQSANKRLLTATSNDEIRLKAGAVVEEDTVILILKNPELEAKLRQALAKLQNSKTQKRSIILQQQKELLDSESMVSELEAEAEISMLQVEAERSLAESGIISGISAKKNELKAKQLSNKVKLEKVKLNKLLALHTEALAIQDDLISQSQEEFDVAKHRVSQLSVKAGLRGVIQRLPLDLGQSVSIGTELALIGSLSPLVAEVKVPQLQAYLVQNGMEAEIGTVNGQVSGQVTRIDPVIEEGAVQIDIEITGVTDNGIKPMQLVDATILADVQKGVHYIKTPTGVNENTSAMLFKLTKENKAVQTEVKFGKVSGQLIQVLSGLQPGDEVITSKLDLSNDVKQIKLS
jgi:HlyD family secretion protein